MAKTWQVILATVAIFLAGLVTGGATALGFVRWAVRHPRVNPAQMLGQQRPGTFQFQPMNVQLMRSFVKQLDLSVEQRARIVPIVRRTVGQLSRDRRETQLASALAIERMQDEIADILNPEQRAKFEDLISQQRARLQQLRQNPPPPPQEGQVPPGPK